MNTILTVLTIIAFLAMVSSVRDIFTNHKHLQNEKKKHNLRQKEKEKI